MAREADQERDGGEVRATSGGPDNKEQPLMGEGRRGRYMWWAKGLLMHLETSWGLAR